MAGFLTCRTGHEVVEMRGDGGSLAGLAPHTLDRILPGDVTFPEIRS